jgi:hypothetical protein
MGRALGIQLGGRKTTAQMSKLKNFLRSHETALLTMLVLVVLFAFVFLLTIGPYYFAKP